MPTVILNADDLGLTPEVNRGIFEAVRAGGVSSASLMVGAPGWNDALERIAAEGSGLSVGLHLNFTVGRPLTPAPTLCDRTGRFLALLALTLRAVGGGIDPEDVLAETAAQLGALADAGVPATHVDGHRHVHLLPTVGLSVVIAARRAAIPFVRMPLEPLSEALRRPATALKQAALRVSATAAGLRLRNAIGFRGQSLLDADDVDRALVGLLERLPEGVTEIAVHPGYVSPELSTLDPYTVGREREVQALTSPDFIGRLRDGSLRVVGFGAL